MRKELDKIIKKYISEFEKKHDLLFEFAVNDDLLDVLVLVVFIFLILMMLFLILIIIYLMD